MEVPTEKTMNQEIHFLVFVVDLTRSLILSQSLTDLYVELGRYRPSIRLQDSIH